MVTLSKALPKIQYDAHVQLPWLSDPVALHLSRPSISPAHNQSRTTCIYRTARTCRLEDRCGRNTTLTSSYVLIPPLSVKSTSGKSFTRRYTKSCLKGGTLLFCAGLSPPRMALRAWTMKCVTPAPRYTCRQRRPKGFTAACGGRA